jgi:xanthine dehydrogenase accessory factor
MLAADLARRGEPFILATVVRREAPSSAQAGDTAIITADGQFHGWLGGSCTRPTVVREAMRALSDGRSGFIALSPNPGAERRPGVTAYPMTCHSGGTVDISIEPVLPRPRLVVFGLSHAARALARLAAAMGYAVEAADPEADEAAFPGADRLWTGKPSPEKKPGARAFAVVATMGERDEDAIAEAIALEPDYLAVISSGKRFAQVREALEARGVPAESLDRIQSPAGFDIGAESPEEIAVSILAQIVYTLRKGAGAEEAPREDAAPGEIDPVCGMTVEVEGARHTAEVAGRTWYFCCGGCRDRFVAAPERFPAGAAPGGMA